MAGENFGCGSSREHAPWALLDFGIRCVIAPSFADIFYGNCFKNGILPIKLPQSEVDKLMDDAERGANAIISIDLEKQEIRGPDGGMIKFEVDEFRKQCLLNGWDDIGLTMRDRRQDRDLRTAAAHPAALDLKKTTNPMNEYKLLLVPGDGIGPEVMDATMRVVGWFGQKGLRLQDRRGAAWAASPSMPSAGPIRTRPSSRPMPPTPC